MLSKHVGSSKHQSKTTIGSNISFIQVKLHQAKEDNNENLNLKVSEILPGPCLK